MLLVNQSRGISTLKILFILRQGLSMKLWVEFSYPELHRKTLPQKKIEIILKYIMYYNK